MDTIEKELVKEDIPDNKDEKSDPGLAAMEVTFGRGRNKRTLLCSKGYTLKKIVEISK